MKFIHTIPNFICQLLYNYQYFIDNIGILNRSHYGIYLSNKRLTELEKQNEELLLDLIVSRRREDNVRNLNDVLKKMRMEVADLNERKLSLAEEIESLREQEKTI